MVTSTPTKMWFVDFEYGMQPGGRPVPRCCVARELFSGITIRAWEEDLRCPTPPYDIDETAILVAYYASAEMSCHLALGWRLPTYVLDLYVEFRNLTNGCAFSYGSSLLGALAYFGIPGLDTESKEEMRALALRGGPYTATERAELIAYCESDVDALQKLYEAMSR